MMSAMSVPLTFASNGLPSSRKPDLRSTAGTPGVSTGEYREHRSGPVHRSGPGRQL